MILSSYLPTLSNQLPIQQQERTVIVDVLRGFALFGVLLGNFSGMVTNNVPQEIIDAHSTGLDSLLNELHRILIENKFMTLFSILFGYGFGVIMQRLETKRINSTPFFFRRMIWLFIFGCLNLALWNGDILHVYAMTGILLLLFRNQSNRSVFRYSIFFLFILPAGIRIYQQYGVRFPFAHGEVADIYFHAYKSGSLKDIVSTNYKMYPREWIFTWIEWRDMSETLGRFLLGYYILRKQILVRLEENMPLIRKVWIYTAAISAFYILMLVFLDKKIISVPGHIIYPFLKFGILSMSLLYATSITQLYYQRKWQRLMQSFRNLGCITLTNYLAETVIYVVLLYGIGFGFLGEFSFGIIWLSSLAIYFLQAAFSKWWLSKFYYGPVEWIWRQLTYRKRFRLSRIRTSVPATT